MAVDPVVQDFFARSMAAINRSLMSEISTLITNSVESIKRSNSEAVEDNLGRLRKFDAKSRSLSNVKEMKYSTSLCPDDESKSHLFMFCPSFDGQEELEVCTDICQDLRTFEFAESSFFKFLHYSVKGRLKASIEFWRFIGAPKFILDIISDGYKIPFITTPPPVHLKNNGSGLEHSDFVSDAILELLQDNRIEELTIPQPRSQGLSGAERPWERG